jgi:L-iditol 2-dehydrogenase
MLCLKLYGANDIRIEDTEIPSINEDEILMKTDAASICGTDIRMLQNGYKGVDKDNPLILGHEFSGTIVKTGKNVRHYEVGMKVTVQPNIGCGTCNRCVSGNFHLCGEYRAFGIHIDGAFAEYVRIPSNAVRHGNLTPLPGNLTLAEAAIIEPLSCTYNGFLKCSPKPGEYALVVGAGPIGICHAMLLNMAGVHVLMNDLSKDRLDTCKKIIPNMSTYYGDNLSGFVYEWTGGRGLDIAIVACPSPEAQAAMLPLMDYGGRINFFGGIPESKEPVALNTNTIHYKELILTGSSRSSIAQFRKTLEFVFCGFVDVKSLITDRYNFSDILTAFERAQQATGLKHVIIF